MRVWVAVLIAVVAVAVVLVAVVAPLFDGPAIRFDTSITEADSSRLDTGLAASAVDRMNCSERAGGPGLDVYVNRLSFADTTGDGREDAVVAMACEGYTAGWPDWVFVLDPGAEKQHLLIDGSIDRRGTAVTALDVASSVVVVSGGFQASPGPEIRTEFVRRFRFTGDSFVERRR